MHQNMFIIYPGATVLFVLIHLAVTKRGRSAEFVWAVILTYAILFNIGFAGLAAFYGHAFIPAEAASFIGWPAGSPFQFEVAAANLAFGLLGVLCVWLRSTFRLATIIGYSVFLIGAAYGHIQQMSLAQNYAPGNAGAPLYVDVIAPPILLALWIIHYVIAKRGCRREPTEAPERQIY
ncbi:MAG: hypothetical protein JXA24_06010 [Proteobacteria bacterium]|nr:hypothetical protein [Pseudomonadota bacterium]